MTLPRSSTRLAMIGLVGALLGACATGPAQPPAEPVGPLITEYPLQPGPVAKAAAAAASSPYEPRIIRGTDLVVAAPTAPALPAAPSSAPVTLRFEDTPVREVVHAILGDLLRLDFVVHPPLEGRVTLISAQPASPDKAIFMLEAALQANGLAIARDARGIYHVGRPEALKGVMPNLRVAGKDPLPPGHGAIVVPLRYIGATEMANILRPLAPGEAIARVDPLRNLLVLVGSRTQAEGWLSLISTFDVDLLEGMSVGVFPLRYLTVRDVEAALALATAAAAGTSPPAPGATVAASGPGGTVAARPLGAAPLTPPSSAAVAAAGNPLFGAMRVLPIERLNSVVIVTPRAAYLEQARKWIERLDQPSSSTAESRLNVYQVRNGSARHLADLLNGIFGTPGVVTAGTGVAPGLGSAAAATSGLAGGAAGAMNARLGAATTSRVTNAPGFVPLSVQVGSGVRVVADERNNAVLIYGPTIEYERIEEALKRLDVPPTQVLIEASILEVTLTDDLSYGLQWKFDEQLRNGWSGQGVFSTRDGNAEGGVLGGALGGFSYVLRNSLGNIRALLNANVDKSLVRVISSPSLMVLDNHTAQIVVGNQTPIRTSQTISSEGNTLTSSIQYKDAGVALSVTPSVSAGDIVTMDINQSVIDVGGIDAATLQRAFLQRQINSKVAVRSGETVVLGGLIRDNTTDGSAGLPLLSEVPVLGALFGRKTRSNNRTELLVVITPRVARSDEDAREISRALRERMSDLKGLGERVVHQPLPEEYAP